MGYFIDIIKSNDSINELIYEKESEDNMGD
jgi:hypothetical protein